MEVRLLDEADTEPYCDLRLRMLLEHPHAFTSSHDEEALKPMRILVLGNSGSGKSTLGNAFVGGKVR